MKHCFYKCIFDVILNQSMNQEQKKKSAKKPWPTKAAMEQVYEMKLWGTKGTSKFYSGEGSHDQEIVGPYKQAILSFFKRIHTPLVVCDLGCGDFNIGKDFVSSTKKYIGVDIVEKLIKHNQNTFQDSNLEFYCLDIATDALPMGDCVIVRQVLQHLSNTEIQKVLPKLTKFKYIILTEHLPNGVFVPNKDIISGQGIRIKKQSGVDVLAAPFDLKIKTQTELNRIVLQHNKGVIVTTLYESF